MEDNPNPTPNVTTPPAPEPTEAPEPAETPTPAEAPEPATAPVAEPAPVPEPAAPATATGIPAAQPKKKKGGLIALIIVLAVLLIGGGVFAFLYFTSHTPEKLVGSAIENYLKHPATSYSSAVEASAAGQSMNYSMDLYAPSQSTVYVRVNGFQNIFGTFVNLISDLTGTDDSETVTANPFEAIDGVWWKADANSIGADSVTSLFGTNSVLADQSRLAAIYQKHPFLTAKAAEGNYSTSGAAFVVSIDAAQYEAFKNEAGDDVNGISLGAIALNPDAEYSSIIVTVKSSLLGNATLTGIYAERSSNGASTKLSANLEKDFSSATNEAKDVSELQKALEAIYGSGSDIEEGDEDDAAAVERDTVRRNDYSSLAANITSYMVNNRGQLPEVGVLDAKEYLNSTGTDPSGHPYHLEVVDYAEDYEMGWGVNPGDDTNVYVVLHATCDANHELAESEAARDFAIAGSLESGEYYCLANR